MNKYKILMLAIALFVILQSVSATPAPSAKVQILNNTLFVYKTDRKFLGASVIVKFQNGDVVMTRTLQKRKTIIDFSNVQVGEYTIRFVKGKRVEEFFYEKS